MMRKRILVVVAAAAALAVPAIVVAGGEEGFVEFDELEGLPGTAVWGTNGAVTTNSREYRNIAGMPHGLDVTVDNANYSPIYVSVDLAKGKARLRLVDGPKSSDPIHPRKVTLAGRGVSTATFWVDADGVEYPSLQWKKVGRTRVRAASVIASTIGEQD